MRQIKSFNFNVNLLQGDKWIADGDFDVEQIPVSCDPLYDKSNNMLSAWATSYEWTTFEQNIRLLDRRQSNLASSHPVIEFSVYITARYDCGAECILSLKFSNGHEWTFERKFTQENDRHWHQITYRYSNYETMPANVTVKMQGKDTLYWAGYYGMKFIEPCLQLKDRAGYTTGPMETDVTIIPHTAEKAEDRLVEGKDQK